MPKVSVIIPVYNCQEYLKRCVDSILAQSLKEIEVVIVNDASTDNSLDICREYEKKHDNLRVVTFEQNQGLTVARAEGVRCATGEYIGFIDSDDWVNCEMYQQLYNIAQTNNLDIVQCGFINTSGEQPECCILENEKVQIFSARDALMQLLGVNGESKFNFLVWNKIYKADIIKKVQLPLHFRSTEDVPSTARTFYAAEKVGVIKSQYVYYFKRNNGKSKSITDILKEKEEKFICSHIEGFYDISCFLKEKDYNLYLASLKYTVQWTLSAMKRPQFSKECKKRAKQIIKESPILNNKYISFKIKLVALVCKIIP